ncbi:MULTISPECIES: hypothetical protein [unclassified Mesorhizobium]|uniref:hypothetical protein n=1 Tax=unclassified Mesorhizobium TaxID=325217 RepID=UPI000FD6212F|nr:MULTISPECIES: hypothetical protein [unclassified Mesorhizobium]RVB72136.1 hypothetical protein EN885_30285 [Mesorhizobium sp. M6A.T.Cr.TU.014.01.1.1]RWP96300.1 MAG: hypothetical protein EOR91_31315 [Mesorhizobium sp.]RWP96409.1 MAG: hypothetical protein EOR90_29970 [Mesorhizobium sp.]
MALNPILAALTSALMRSEKPTNTAPAQQKRRPSALARREKPVPFMSRVPTAYLQNPIDGDAIEQKRAADAAHWRDALRR